MALALGLPAGALAAINFKAALGLILAGAVAVLMLVGAEYLLLGVVAVEPWSDALQKDSIPKIVGFLAVSSWGLAALTGRVKLRFTPQMGWAFAFLLVIVLSFLAAPDASEGSGATISYILYVLFLGLFVQSIRTSRDVERCLSVYTASMALGCFYALYTFTAGVAHLASGPISDPNDYASTLGGGLPLAVYFAVHARRHRWLWRGACLLLVATLLATLSRGALVGFGVVVVWAILRGRISLAGIVALGVALILGVGVGLVFFKPIIEEHLQEKSHIATTNVDSRKAFWLAAVKMAENHPLLGVGTGRFPDEVANYVTNDPSVLVDPVTHESYLEILAEDGVFALMLYLTFLASSLLALRKARRLAHAAGDARGVDLADALIAGFLWTCVTLFFISWYLAIPLWLFSGIAGALVLSRQGEPSVLPPPRTPARRSVAGGPFPVA